MQYINSEASSFLRCNLFSIESGNTFNENYKHSTNKSAKIKCYYDRTAFPMLWQNIKLGILWKANFVFCFHPRNKISGITLIIINWSPQAIIPIYRFYLVYSINYIHIFHFFFLVENWKKKRWTRTNRLMRNPIKLLNCSMIGQTNKHIQFINKNWNKRSNKWKMTENIIK